MRRLLLLDDWMLPGSTTLTRNELQLAIDRFQFSIIIDVEAVEIFNLDLWSYEY